MNEEVHCTAYEHERGRCAHNVYAHEVVRGMSVGHRVRVGVKVAGVIGCVWVTNERGFTWIEDVRNLALV